MDKKLKDALVGIFVIGGVILFIVFYIWLSGRLGFRATQSIKVYFNDVTGLRVGDPVMVYGLQKGKVRSLQIESDKVLAVLALERDIVLPEDSWIAIRSVTYLGSDRYVKIVPGKAKTTADIYYGFNETLDLESIALQLDTLANFLQGFKLPGFEDVGIKLSQTLDKTIQKLSGVFNKPGDNLNVLIQRLDTLTLLIKGEGTVGKLLKSDELYEEVGKTNRALRELIDDIKANPKKYLGIKVF